MSSLLHRIGQACFRHCRVVLAVWIVIIAGLAVLAVSVKQPTTDSFTIPGTDPNRRSTCSIRNSRERGEHRRRRCSPSPPGSR